MIYAIANATDGKTRAELEEMMKIDKADNKTIKVHEETDKGIYPYWTTKEDSSIPQSIGSIMPLHLSVLIICSTHYRKI